MVFPIGKDLATRIYLFTHYRPFLPDETRIRIKMN
jgi:hypothetical protein